jgi:hypothetical protein
MRHAYGNLGCGCAATVMLWTFLASAGEAVEDRTEGLKDSLVYVESSSYPYDQYRPWKRANLRVVSGYACAVGPREVLTSAGNVDDATVVRVRRLGMNDFIPARVKFVDYESDLSLIELEPGASAPALVPLAFDDTFAKGARVDFAWLSADGQLETGRGDLEDPRVEQTALSHTLLLHHLVSDVSHQVEGGQLCLLGKRPIGIVSSAVKRRPVNVIAAATIIHFLADAADGAYDGFPVPGFDAVKLLDPVLRRYLKIPAGQDNGVLVTEVHTIGTGADLLKPRDVIAAIDGTSIDAHGRYDHPVFKKTVYNHLIASKKVGEKLRFTVWRDGRELTIEPEARTFKASDMLVPYHEYDRQPEYVVTAGFLFQKLTLPFLMAWGTDWRGKVAPHLNHYHRTAAYDPTPERRDIVVLSYVLPADINIGYHDLRQLVVKTVNGKAVSSMKDFLEARKLAPDSFYDVIEFENDNPTVVIPRAQAGAADQRIAQRYGIPELMHVEGVAGEK